MIPLHANPNMLDIRLSPNIDPWPSPNNNFYNTTSLTMAHLVPGIQLIQATPMNGRPAVPLPRPGSGVAALGAPSRLGHFEMGKYKVFVKCTPLKLRRATKKQQHRWLGAGSKQLRRCTSTVKHASI